MKRHYLIQSIKALAVSLLIVVVVNILSSFLYHRFDLTEEKRYTLTTSTKKLLNSLDDKVDVEIYLTGKDLPAGIKILQNETRELLQEFRNNSKGLVTFHFFDYNSIKNQKQREEFQMGLVKKGLRPTNLEVKSNSGYSEKLVFPGAVIKSNGREIPIQILENQFSTGAQGALNNSISLLEYKLANAIDKIIREHPPKVVFLQGQGELGVEPLQEFLKALAAQNFQLDKIELDKDKLLHNNIDVLVVAKPQKPFTENEKFLIDQYVMNGGKVLWLLDNTIADLDSFKLAPSIVAVPRDLNIDDLLFRYGVRNDHNLVLDLYCNQIPIIESIGGNPQPKLFPWVFYPIAVSKNNHPIVKNLDPVAFKFTSSLDTLSNPSVKKTILLSSSNYSRVQPTPFQIYLEGAKQKPNPYLFNQKNIPLAVLLEGNFTSLYKNQYTSDLQKLLEAQQITFKPKSNLNKMIVIADGDIASNDLEANGVPLALGYDKYTRQLYANKDFLLNSIEYLIDNNNLIDARNREVKMRLLDKAKVLEQKTKWQIIIFTAPLLLIAVFGIFYSQRRKRKYAR
ncbi:MAG TPA: gliding motility-associated ABC transporter substrate-binding protein GldG [Chitinophagales bacterium]|jgi:ABC-2 type transport system permease protein|nr:gliding motility-associated ABC transporter substrate-binding protein GldG [Chitinophagales bacterium]